MVDTSQIKGTIEYIDSALKNLDKELKAKEAVQSKDNSVLTDIFLIKYSISLLQTVNSNMKTILNNS